MFSSAKASGVKFSDEKKSESFTRKFTSNGIIRKNVYFPGVRLLTFDF